MIIQFTLYELMIFLLIALGIAALIILLFILIKTKKVVSNLESMVETNKESINKSIKTMPGIFENVGQISNDFRETSDKLKVSAPLILQDAEDITGAVKVCIGNEVALKKGTPGFMAYFHVFEEVLHIISGIFSSEK